MFFIVNDGTVPPSRRMPIEEAINHFGPEEAIMDEVKYLHAQIMFEPNDLVTARAFEHVMQQMVDRLLCMGVIHRAHLTKLTSYKIAPVKGNNGAFIQYRGHSIVGDELVLHETYHPVRTNLLDAVARTTLRRNVLMLGVMHLAYSRYFIIAIPTFE